MKHLSVYAFLAGTLLYQAAHAHDFIPEDETLHLEVVAIEFTEGNYNWFSKDADLYRGANQAMLEPLYFVSNETGALKPWLADGQPDFSDDFTEITIPLNPAARWSDGVRFSAEDVAFSLRFSAGKPGLDAPHVAEVRAALRHVAVAGPHTIRIRLNSPDPDFLIRHFSASNGTSYPIVPRHIWSAVESAEALRDLPPIGTGPYEMVQSSRSDHVTWERLTWWGTTAGIAARPMPHRLIWHPSGTLPKHPHQLSGGARDSIGELTRRVANGLARATARTASWQGLRSPPASPHCGYMAYLYATDTVWGTQEARNALFSLLDRGRLSRQVYAPALDAAPSFFPPNALTRATRDELASREALLPLSQDIAAATEALQAVGCTLTRSDGGNPAERGSGRLLCPLPDQGDDDPPQSVSIDVLFDEADFGARAIARELAGSWRSFSIETAVEAKALADLDASIKAKERGLYVYPMTCAPDEDPLETLRRLMQDPAMEGAADAVEARLALFQGSPGRDAIADAYLEATAAYDAQPLAFTSRVSPASTYFWLGWPISGEHDTWSQRMHLILHALEEREM